MRFRRKIILPLLVALLTLSSCVVEDAQIDNHEDLGDDDGSFNGMGNTQGNYAMNLSQVSVGNSVILTFQGETYRLDTESQQLSYLCQKSECTHTEYPCVSRYSITRMQSYGNRIYCQALALPQNQILVIKNSNMDVFYECEKEINEFFMKDGKIYIYIYIYICALEDVRCVDIETKKETVIHDKPVMYGCFNVQSNEKIYFCTEDYKLYEMDYDGSNKKLIGDDLAVYPQLYDGYVYYRTMNMGDGKYGLDNDLVRVNLTDGTREVIAEDVGLFNICSNGIYYKYADPLSEKFEDKMYLIVTNTQDAA